MTTPTQSPPRRVVLHCPECCRDLVRKYKGKSWQTLPEHTACSRTGKRCNWSGKKGIKP